MNINREIILKRCPSQQLKRNNFKNSLPFKVIYIALHQNAIKQGQLQERMCIN